MNKTLGRAQDPRASGAWLSKLTEVFILGQIIDQKARRDGREARGNEEREKREDCEREQRGDRETDKKTI